jgi:choice-of-anchor B domain-containing protein
MHNKYYTLLLFLVVSFTSFSQSKSYNTTLMSATRFNENASGMWGFTQHGIDYAVIGTINRTKVFSVADPTKPVLVYDIPASNSIWREARYHKKHIYVTNDRGTDGVIIIDMTDVNNIKHKQFHPKITLAPDVDKEINTCHAINMDPKGLLSLTGCNVGTRGVLMYDVETDPWNPIYLGATNLVYAHDTYNDGDTMFVSEITSGRLGIYNIKDKANPVLINTQTTSKAFTHNAWTSVDKKYIFTTDEREGSWVDAYDITDLNNLKLVDRYQIDNALRTIPHNTYNNNDYLITSWYTEGIRVIDVHKPDNMIEVAGYSTWEEPGSCHAGFFGCWGVYPFAQNNMVFGSDMQYGLYVVKVDYVRACYLEGKITDAAGNPIVNARIQIVADQLNGDNTNGIGEFKTGLAASGTYDVLISHPDFAAKKVSVVLDHGVVTMLNTTLLKEAPASIKINVKGSGNQSQVANVLLKNDFDSFSFETDNNGSLNLSNFKSGTYDIFISSWGLVSTVVKGYVIAPGSSKTVDYVLSTGYTDNFETESDWTAESTVSGGGWYRGKPSKTTHINGVTAAPGTDSDDNGDLAYVTGSITTAGAACDDVDNGKTIISSPIMDLTKISRPTLSFDAWFYNAGGNSPINDTLKITLVDKATGGSLLLETVYGVTNGWVKFKNIDLENIFSLIDINFGLSKEMQIVVSTEDRNESGHILEAGFDNFSLVSGTSSSNQTSIYGLEIKPVPASDYIQISLGDKAGEKLRKYSIHTANGINVASGNLSFHTEVMDISDYAPGVYIIQVIGHEPTRFVKL